MRNAAAPAVLTMEYRTGMTRLTIFVVEDSPPVRDRIREVVDEIPQAILVGEAESEQDAVTGIAATRPKLVILDINLREGTGFEVLRQVKASAPDTIVAVVTNFSSIEFREKCKQLGADYFFDKTKSYKLLVELMHQLASKFETVD